MEECIMNIHLMNLLFRECNRKNKTNSDNFDNKSECLTIVNFSTWWFPRKSNLALYLSTVSSELCLILYTHLQPKGFFLAGKDCKFQVHFSSKAWSSCHIANLHLLPCRTSEKWTCSRSIVTAAMNLQCFWEKFAEFI